MNFGGVFVFEDVSIEIPPGKVTACIGPNGAGKTTIINIVCGVFPPKAGDIYVDGVRLTGVRPFDTVRHGLCRSFQDVRIFPFLTALENVLVAMPNQSGETDQRPVSAERARAGARQPREGPPPVAGRRARQRGGAAGRRIAVRSAEAFVAVAGGRDRRARVCCSTSQPPA